MSYIWSIWTGWYCDYVQFCRWKLVQLGLDDQYKRLNEVRGKDRLPNTQVSLRCIGWSWLVMIGQDWTQLVMIGQDWSWLVTIRHDWSWLVRIGHDWSWLVTIGQDWSWLVMIGQDWSQLVMIGHDWSGLVRISHDWSWLVRIGHDWSRLVMIGHDWSWLVRIGQDWSGLVMIGHNWPWLVMIMMARNASSTLRNTGTRQLQDQENKKKNNRACSESLIENQLLHNSQSNQSFGFFCHILRCEGGSPICWFCCYWERREYS